MSKEKTNTATTTLGMYDESIPLNDLKPQRNRDLKTVGKVFLVAVSIEALFVIIITFMQKFVFHFPFDDHMKLSIILCLAVVFLVYFAVDGVLNENRFELVCYLVISLLVYFYTLYNFFTMSQPIMQRPLMIWFRFLIVLLLGPLTTILGWISYKTFGWRIYRKVGANPELIHMYKTYQIFLSFLKMDLQFGLTIVTGVSLFTGLVKNNIELGLDIVFFVITILWASLGWYTVRHEKRSLIWVFLVFALVEPAYIIWKDVETILSTDTEFEEGYAAPSLGLSALAIICRVLLIVWTLLVYKHFNRGLRDVFEQEENDVTVPILSG